MAGMRDVAKLAGVSLSTVSIVMNQNGDKFVSEETKLKVMKAAEEIGYRMPKPRKKDRVIAVVLPQIASTFYSNLLNGVEDAAQAQEYVLIVGNTSFSFEKEQSFMKMIRKQDLAGVLVDTVCPKNQIAEYYSYLKENFVNQGIPVRFLLQQTEDDSIPCVYVNHREIAVSAVDHLVAQGRTKIAHIAGPLNNRVADFRLNGYLDAVSKAGSSIDEELIVHGDYTPTSGYLCMKELLRKNCDFDAVYAANDQMAIGAIKALVSEGRRVPEDVAVVGTDNLSLSSMIEPSLTTVQIPTYQIGRTAAKLLIERDDSGNLELPSRLIVRQSTDHNSPSDWDLFGW